jgi:hypothetical protein
MKRLNAILSASGLVLALSLPGWPSTAKRGVRIAYRSLFGKSPSKNAASVVYTEEMEARAVGPGNLPHRREWRDY